MKSLLMLLTLLSLTSFGETYIINKDHSSIKFSIDYMGLSEVDGNFLKFKGHANYNDVNGKVESVDLEIDPKSIFSGNKMRDQHLREGDFFAVSAYPKIKFSSKSVRDLGEDKIEVDGVLSMRGVEKRVVFKGVKTKTILDTWGHKSFFTKVEGIIKRKDFNLKWNKTLEGAGVLVGEDVRVKVSLQFQPSGGKTPFSKHKIPDTKEIRLRERFVRGEISKEDYSVKKYDGPGEVKKGSEVIYVPKESSVTVKEEDMHKTMYTKFKKDSNWYYLSSMLLSLFSIFGYLSIRKKIMSINSVILKRSSQIIVAALFASCVYVVSFDDFMAFSISIFK